MPVERFDMPSGRFIYYKDGPEYHESQRHTYWTGYDAAADKVSGRVGGISTIASAGSGESGSADGLMGWAIKLYKQGVDFKEERERLGDIGTAAHDVLQALCEGETPAFETGHEMAVISWFKTRRPDVQMFENIVYDHEHGFAGRFDLLYGTTSKTLLDLKTGSVRNSACIQLNLYRIAMRAAGFPVPDLLHVLDTSDDGSWREIEIPIRPEWALDAMRVHRNGKEMARCLRVATKEPRTKENPAQQTLAEAA